MQLPLWTPPSEWRPPDLATLPSWKDARRIAIDCETHDEHLKELGIGVRRGAYMVGVSFCIEDGPKHYLPFGHENGDNLDKKACLRYLRAQAKTFKGDLVGAKLEYDLDHLWAEEILFPQVEFYRDIQVAAPLIYELEHSYSLQNIATRLGLPGKNEDLLREAAKVYGVDPKSGLWRLPARYVGAYAEDDTEQPLQVLRRQERFLEEKDLWDIWDLESRLLPVLVRMRRRGVRVDMAKLEKIETWTLTEEAKALRTIKRETGYDPGVGNIWKADALAPVFRILEIDLTETSKGDPNIDQALFKRHKGVKAIDAIAHARKVNKLRTTFAAQVRRYETNGRIHCTFNQIAREDEKGDQKGVRYGRLSATDPNLQQQPSRDEFAAMWRSIYIPEDGALWGSADYSQQEPRWTTHFAALMDLPKARETAQAYRDDPTLDNHAFMAEITGIERKFAKNIYLGVCYGEGGAKLCDDLGLPTRWSLSRGRGKDWRVEHFDTFDLAMEARHEYGEGFVWRSAGAEGQAIMDKFDTRAPFIRKVARAAKDRASSRGFVTTILGRRLHFPQKPDGSYDWVHKALNRVIQGSGADQMKKGLVLIDREMPDTFLQLQIHDSTESSVSGERELRRVAEIMKHSIEDTLVPFHVGVEIGPSWGELEKLAVAL